MEEEQVLKREEHILSLKRNWSKKVLNTIEASSLCG